MAFKSEPIEPSLPPAPIQKPPVDKEARSKALKIVTDYRRATAWQVHRWPYDKRVAEDKTKIHLPRSYLAKTGEDVKNVWAGADLNQIVHQHYIKTVKIEDLSTDRMKGNFVTPDNISAERHEFLGPDPRIAGYFFDVDGEIHVKWWDSFLQDQWMDKTKWKFDVRLGDDGKWVEKDD
ncbi:hypothetical protein PHLCEN_2v5161 [Hermanssonia centrifuga]|uniref:Uncharacterized protein n=1 Tax=Hermanssonia centrifuga TaxID=98765 RepID=A0A2R6P8Q2_9APHY|nr:hypothetical protein PHLCEN_2v5161 [Hermanssonia centrifuga]